ncbi:type II toxin-antitoxin system prevent-host-death family antitoxin [Streptomyces sp. NPDC001381]|uniref:type II toxin-antitoxin system prevent-host-death family antitoxin n=1 Tax=Streptomyces sp. NPDC001381 TaxID=3364567 RepID=UPI0036775E43
MEALMNDDSHDELGIGEARKLLTSLVAGVKQDGRPVRLTKHGHHVASIVSAEDAERLRSWAVDPIEVPGDVATATRIIEGLLPGGSNLLPDYRAVQAMDKREITGGLATILRSLLLVIRMKYPYGRISLSEEGESAPRVPISVADLIMHKVLNEAIGSALTVSKSGEEVTGFNESEFDGSAVAVVAGALWAAQVGANPIEWRNSIKRPIGERELLAWISTTYEAADFVRFMIDGEFLAEEDSGEGIFWLREIIYGPESLLEVKESEE